MTQWQFWVDRGGTFTDLVACTPTGELRTHKLLSENPEHYKDAAVQGIRDLLGLSSDEDIPTGLIHSVKIDRKSTRLNSSHSSVSRMPSSA